MFSKSLFHALHHNLTEQCSFLLRQFPSYKDAKDGNTSLLMEAIYEKNLSIINLLIELGANVNYTYHWYEDRGMGIDGDRFDENVLGKALHAGDLAIITTVLKAGATINSSITTEWDYSNREFATLLMEYNILPLYSACRGGHLDFITTLIKIAHTDNNGLYGALIDTLTYAEGSWQGENHVPNLLQVVTALIKAGASVNGRAYPLIMALKLKDSSIAQYLLAAGADATFCDGSQRNALHHAAEGNGACIEALYKAGSQVNKQDYFNATPLHLAASRDNLLAAKELLQLGADKTLKDKRGETALDYALKYSVARGRNAEMINILSNSAA